MFLNFVLHRTASQSPLHDFFGVPFAVVGNDDVITPLRLFRLLIKAALALGDIALRLVPARRIPQIRHLQPRPIMFPGFFGQLRQRLLEPRRLIRRDGLGDLPARTKGQQLPRIKLTVRPQRKGPTSGRLFERRLQHLDGLGAACALPRHKWVASNSFSSAQKANKG